MKVRQAVACTHPQNFQAFSVADYIKYLSYILFLTSIFTDFPHLDD